MNNGAIVDLSIHGIRNDSMLNLGDTAIVNYSLTPRAGDSLTATQGRFTVLLGFKPWKFKDNMLLKYAIQSTWHSGEIRLASVTVVPDSGVISGRLDLHGKMTLNLQYRDGGTGDFIADYRDGKIRASLNEQRAGIKKAYRLVYNSQGDLEERTILP